MFVEADLESMILFSRQKSVSCMPKSAKVDGLLTCSTRFVDFLRHVDSIRFDGAETLSAGRFELSKLVVWTRAR